MRKYDYGELEDRDDEEDEIQRQLLAENPDFDISDDEDRPSVRVFQEERWSAARWVTQSLSQYYVGIWLRLG